MNDLDRGRIDTIIRFALKEDIQTGDITSNAVIDKFDNVDAVILSRGKGVVCGMEIAERVFTAVDPTLRFRPAVKDGDHIEPDQEIAFVEGKARSVLKGERTALNFLALLSGVSTATREMVDAVSGTGVKIYDTRKTVPLHRYLQKYAVTVGGGYNHRRGLWDMVLIKDNHLRICAMRKKSADNAAIIREIVREARSSVQKNIRVEIEVENLKECEAALEEKPDVIMLDNMAPDQVKRAVELRKGKGLEKAVLFEVSGGIDLDNIGDYARAGADIISTGSITTAKPLDYSLEIIMK